MIIIDIGNNISLKIADSSSIRGDAIHIDIYVNKKKLQPIIRFDNYPYMYSLFKWRNEGHLPECIDTIKGSDDKYRLMIIGVDEI